MTNYKIGDMVTYKDGIAEVTEILSRGRIEIAIGYVNSGNAPKIVRTYAKRLALID